MSHKSGHSSLFAIETYCSIFFPTRQHTHKSYSETYSNPTMCSNIFLKEHSHFFTIVFSKDSPLIGLPSQRGFQLRLKSCPPKFPHVKAKCKPKKSPELRKVKHQDFYHVKAKLSGFKVKIRFKGQIVFNLSLKNA